MQSAADTFSPLVPLGQVDEWTAKPSRSSIWIICRNLLELWRRKHFKKSVSLTDSEVQTFLEGEENHNIQKEKPKVTYSVAFVLVFLSAEDENWQLEDLPILAVYLKDFFCR